MQTIDIIIPSYKPDEKLRKCIGRLQKQTVKPRQIFIINTEEAYWDTALNELPGVRVIHITKDEFDHGGTRRMASYLTDAEIMVCMTQDAVPADMHLLEELIKPFDDLQVAASYARQLPGSHVGEVERYTRLHNYPEEARRTTKEDKERLGIKTYSCSNVCAAYRKSIYEELGGFVGHTIFNEDMIMASKMIEAGYAVFYAAAARVHHSHRYSCRQQFQRNFDLGVSQKQYAEVFAQVPPESAGIRLVKETAGYLLSNGKFYLLPDLLLQSAFKYLGFRIGRNYDKLPVCVVKKCTMNRNYWK